MKKKIQNQSDASHRNAADNIDSSTFKSPPGFQPSADNIQMKEEDERTQMKSNPFQMKVEEEEEEMQMKSEPYQMQVEEEEEELQMKGEPYQMQTEEEEEEMQMKGEPYQMQVEEEEEELQMKAGNGNTGAASSTREAVPTDVMQQMESSFAADFSDVNIHSNSERASALGAQAYTQGSDIHFAPGKYNPGSSEGKELLGHELTHVVQQKQGRVSGTTKHKGQSINDNSGLEQEADDMGRKAAQNQSVDPTGVTQAKKTEGAPPVVQRQESEGEKMLGLSKIAVNLHEAMDGWGTDEKAIFKALLPLSKSQVKSVKRVFKALYGKDLLAELRSELNDSDFRTVLIYTFYWPPTNSTIGSYQSEQAKEKILEFSGWKVSMFSDLLDMLNYNQRAYLWKALAAGNDMIPLINFAYKIKGKNDEWLQNNLSLTNQTDGRGIKQQWNDSCGPTTAQAVQGQLDPIYALSVRESNRNINKHSTSNPGGYNGNAATDQKNLLEWGGGTAVARGASGGNGMGMGDVMRIIEDRTGIDYDVQWAGGDKGAAMSRVDEILAMGIPVPIRVGGAGGGHFVLITHKSGNSYNIHDVWAGRSFTRSRSKFVNNNMNIAGWPNFTHYGNPK